MEVTNKRKFFITHNDNGFHICGKSYWFDKQFIEHPLYHTCATYQKCIEWLDENFPNGYEIVRENKEVSNETRTDRDD